MEGLTEKIWIHKIIRRIAIWSHIIWILITHTLDNTRHVHVLRTHLSSMELPSPTDHIAWVKNVCACIECMGMRPACHVLRIDIGTKQIPLELVHAWVWTLSIKIYCQLFGCSVHPPGPFSVLSPEKLSPLENTINNVYFDFRHRSSLPPSSVFSRNCVKSPTLECMNENDNRTKRHVSEGQKTHCATHLVALHRLGNNMLKYWLSDLQSQSERRRRGGKWTIQDLSTICLQQVFCRYFSCFRFLLCEFWILNGVIYNITRVSREFLRIGFRLVRNYKI